jgi:hypothetical protein
MAGTETAKKAPVTALNGGGGDSSVASALVESVAMRQTAIATRFMRSSRQRFNWRALEYIETAGDDARSHR